ncbi:hypothetical protein HQ393_16620 [Chitinibacter bivalviorum]|uniref:Transporter substrate-binding domain-containing protein n=1 Tax=Chitinibacter bivalviorum TaxID=2739434 RepID=A0A7H9BM75_9NEIS|nr:hypothetical protein [Chitinibacter bivalviorum]QLG89737.1 hypothetical protein HQ393_16620 [Chitinibacter bivalviorum]
MTFKPAILLYLLCALLSPLMAQGDEQIIRMRPKQGAIDTSHDYFIGLVRLALQKTPEQGPARIVEISTDMPQARALLELSRGNLIDLDWAGTNIEREKLLRPIRIPLDGGLLGHRALVIRKESIPQFGQIKTAQDLAKYTGIQGSQWPDTAILELAGLKIEKPPKFEMMYPMLINRRGDYFPRGLNEVYAEFATLNNPDLVVYDKLLLVYKMPMYFFTAKNNTVLATRIEKGLRQAISDGSMLDYMKKSPVTAKLFPLSKYQGSRKIYLNNPSLPPETPINDASLWLNLN